MIIGDVLAPHLVKWSRALFEAGIDLHLWSLNKPERADYQDELFARISSPGINVDANKEGTVGKLGYLKQLGHLRQTIQRVRPDILHAHYATSYGLLGALSGMKNFIISVWGSDVMSFPDKSAIHRLLLRKVLSRAAQVQASGEFLRKITEQFTDKVKVVNFGLENSFFSRNPVKVTGVVPEIVIGSVKSLESHYRIDVLIKAFAIAKKKSEISQNLKLLIVGDGALKSDLQKLSVQEGISDEVEFTGRQPYSTIADFHRRMDIHVCTSERESFGVSILEAMALGIPVICSDIPAFDELVTDGVTGLRFRQGEPDNLAAKILSLINDDALKQSLLTHAAERAQYYKLNRCVTLQIETYRSLLSKRV